MKQSIRFWIDFGRILAPNLAPFWPNFGSKNRSKIKVDFCTKKGMDAKSLWEPNFRDQGTENFSGEGPKSQQDIRLGQTKTHNV